MSEFRGGSDGAERNSNFRLNGSASHNERPMRRNKSAARRSSGYNS